jgi:plasmid replication initiation protein
MEAFTLMSTAKDTAHFEAASSLNVEQPAPQAERFKDELNFAEFPLASLADRVPEDQKTLEFNDTIFDQSIGTHITRKLTIAASDKFGLPRALDEEVILGLIQLTNRQLFRDKKVHFSSYELIKLLGWNDSAKSYRRIEESLKRWVSITLFYDKAWWSKEEQCWVNENFHILESVTIYDRERRASKKALNPEDENAGKSYFVWNDIVFRSFQSGNLKEIDLDIYRELKSAISKRMYRFLDKHFYRRARLEYDLERFAFEHVGISRTSTLAEVKRLLSKPLLELESIGFIKPLPKEERFIKVTKGQWRIVFDRGSSEARVLMSPEQVDVLEQLKGRGVTTAKASKLVRAYEPSRIAEKISIHDWLLSRADKRCSANPPGFLVAAIQDDFPAPTGFLKSREQAKSELRVITAHAVNADKPNIIETQTRAKVEQPVVPSELDQRFDAFWQTLAETEREQFEQEAFEHAEPFNQRFYVERKEEGGILFKTIRRSILVTHFAQRAVASE